MDNNFRPVVQDSGVHEILQKRNSFENCKF